MYQQSITKFTKAMETDFRLLSLQHNEYKAADEEDNNIGAEVDAAAVVLVVEQASHGCWTIRRNTLSRIKGLVCDSKCTMD